MTDERLAVLLGLLRRHPDPKSAKLAADELERYIGELTVDKKRLDWLDSLDVHGWIRYEHFHWCAAKIRLAIDSAMETQ